MSHPSMPAVMIFDDVAARVRTASVKNYESLFLLDMAEALLKEVRDWSCISCGQECTGGRIPEGGYRCPCGGYRAPVRWVENYRLAGDNHRLIEELALRMGQIEALQQQVADLQTLKKGDDNETQSNQHDDR